MWLRERIAHSPLVHAVSEPAGRTACGRWPERKDLPVIVLEPVTCKKCLAFIRKWYAQDLGLAVLLK